MSNQVVVYSSLFAFNQKLKEFVMKSSNFSRVITFLTLVMMIVTYMVVQKQIEQSNKMGEVLAAASTAMDNQSKVIKDQTAVMEQQEIIIAKLQAQNIRLSTDKAMLTIELSNSNNKLANALVPEATVKEAAEVHVVKPMKEQYLS